MSFIWITFVYVVCPGGHRALLSPLRSGVEWRGGANCADRCLRWPQKPLPNEDQTLPPSPRPSLDICLRNENEVAGAGGERAPAVFSQVSSAIWERTVQYVTQEAADGRNEYRQASAPPLASPLPIQSYLAQHPEFRGIIGRIRSFLPFVPCLT